MTVLIAWLVLSPFVALLVARCIAGDESAPSAPARMQDDVPEAGAA